MNLFSENRHMSTPTLEQRHLDAVDEVAYELENADNYCARTDEPRIIALRELPAILLGQQAEIERLRVDASDLHFAIASAVYEFNTCMFPVDATFKVKDILRLALIAYADSQLTATTKEPHYVCKEHGPQPADYCSTCADENLADNQL